MQSSLQRCAARSGTPLSLFENDVGHALIESSAKQNAMGAGECYEHY